MAIDNIIQDSWQGHSHGEVEEALKAKLVELVQIISGIPTGNNSVTYNMLSQQVKSILTLAQNALQSGDVPTWARQANKPEYNASEIDGLEELIAGIEAGTASIADDTLTENAQKALSARQGTVIRAKINLLQQKIDALIDALANIAFTNGKTASLKVGTIDWQDPVVQEPVLTSPTNNSTVNVGEIAHDSSTAITKTITVKGENLTKALGVSVSGTGFSVSTNSISAAAANAGTTITVTFNQSTADSYTGTLVISSSEVSATVTLTASKAASQELQTFDVEVSGTNCDITGESSVSEGGTWSGQVSVNTGYHLSTGTVNDFTIVGTYGTATYSNGVLTITNVTSDISISVTADINQYTITPNATNCSINASSFTVSHGGTFYGTVVPNSADYELPSTVSYGNGQTAAVSSNGSFTITNVTSDLTVTATAVPLAPSMTVKDSNNNTLASGSTFDLGTIATGGTSVSKTITVQGLHLTSALSLAASGTGFSVSPATISAQDAASGQQVTLTYTNNGAGDNTDKTGSLAISGGGLSNFTLALKAKKATATVSLANGGHCSLNSGSIGSDGTYTGILQPDTHYDLPSTISAVMGSTPITFDGTTNSYNSSTGAIQISNVSNNVVITAVAVAQVPITVTFPQDHSHMIIKHGDDVLSGDSVSVYSDMLDYVITFEAAPGYKFTSGYEPSVGGTALTGSNGVYTLTVNSVSDDITVDATVEALAFKTITLNTAGLSQCTSDKTGSQVIYEGEALTVILTPSSGYSMESASAKVGSSAVGHSSASVGKAYIFLPYSNASITDGCTVDISAIVNAMTALEQDYLIHSYGSCYPDAYFPLTTHSGQTVKYIEDTAPNGGQNLYYFGTNNGLSGYVSGYYRSDSLSPESSTAFSIIVKNVGVYLSSNGAQIVYTNQLILDFTNYTSAGAFSNINNGSATTKPARFRVFFYGSDSTGNGNRANGMYPTLMRLSASNSIVTTRFYDVNDSGDTHTKYLMPLPNDSTNTGYVSGISKSLTDIILVYTKASNAEENDTMRAYAVNLSGNTPVLTELSALECPTNDLRMLVIGAKSLSDGGNRNFFDRIDVYSKSLTKSEIETMYGIQAQSAE